MCFYIRCDANPDCPEDGSDENDCQVMRLQKGYNKKYSPEKNTTVLIDIEVKDIKLINELESDYTLLVKVTLKWFDPRITFKNLKKSHYENQLGPTEIDTIWTPELLFLHSNEIYIKAGEQKEGIDGTVRVHREGLPQLNELTEINEDYLYPGNDNPISMVNYHVIKLGCKFDLRMYVIHIYYYYIFVQLIFCPDLSRHFLKKIFNFLGILLILKNVQLIYLDQVSTTNNLF